MVKSLLLALQQLAESRMQRLIVRCVALALLVFVGLAGAVGLGLSMVDITGILWLNTVLTVLGSGATVVIAWLLFPATVAVILNFFAEGVADEVEAKHYPHLPPPSGQPLSDSMWGTVRFTAVALSLNILALPVYFLPVANIAVFLAINGYLLGREYFELVALRRMPRHEVTALRRAERGRLWLAGLVIAMMLAIPVFNLIAPVIATAFMVHLFQQRRPRRTFTPAPSMGSTVERHSTWG